MKSSYRVQGRYQCYLLATDLGDVTWGQDDSRLIDIDDAARILLLLLHFHLLPFGSLVVGYRNEAQKE